MWRVHGYTPPHAATLLADVIALCGERPPFCLALSRACDAILDGERAVAVDDSLPAQHSMLFGQQSAANNQEYCSLAFVTDGIGGRIDTPKPQIAHRFGGFRELMPPPPEGRVYRRSISACRVSPPVIPRLSVGRQNCPKAVNRNGRLLTPRSSPPVDVLICL